MPLKQKSKPSQGMKKPSTVNPPPVDQPTFGDDDGSINLIGVLVAVSFLALVGAAIYFA